MLPKKAIEEFKKLYKKKFGIDLSYTETTRRANNLVSLYKAVYKKSSLIDLTPKKNIYAKRKTNPKISRISS